MELIKTRARILNTSFISNSADSFTNPKFECEWGGGAITVINSDVSIIESIFMKNNALTGGAIFGWLSKNITVVSCIFIENQATCAHDLSSNCTGCCHFSTCSNSTTDGNGKIRVNGGAIAAYHSKVQIHSESIFRYNRAIHGGAVYALNATVKVSCSEFLNNSASFEGGAIDATNAAIVVNGSRVCNNTARYGGCLLYTSPSPRDATLSRMPSSA